MTLLVVPNSAGTPNRVTYFKTRIAVVRGPDAGVTREIVNSVLRIVFPPSPGFLVLAAVANSDGGNPDSRDRSCRQVGIPAAAVGPARVGRRRHGFAFPRPDPARVLQIVGPLEEERAQGMPGAGRTRSLVGRKG